LANLLLRRKLDVLAQKPQWHQTGLPEYGAPRLKVKRKVNKVYSEQACLVNSWDPSLIFDPSFAENQPTPHDTKNPMKLFLVHTMLFFGSMWKNESG
jgi:hypothetical protein